MRGRKAANGFTSATLATIPDGNISSVQAMTPVGRPHGVPLRICPVLTDLVNRTLRTPTSESASARKVANCGNHQAVNRQISQAQLRANHASFLVLAVNSGERVDALPMNESITSAESETDGPQWDQALILCCRLARFQNMHPLNNSLDWKRRVM